MCPLKVTPYNVALRIYVKTRNIQHAQKVEKRWNKTPREVRTFSHYLFKNAEFAREENFIKRLSKEDLSIELCEWMTTKTRERDILGSYGINVGGLMMIIQRFSLPQKTIQQEILRFKYREKAAPTVSLLFYRQNIRQELLMWARFSIQEKKNFRVGTNSEDFLKSNFNNKKTYFWLKILNLKIPRLSFCDSSVG